MATEKAKDRPSNGSNPRSFHRWRDWLIPRSVLGIVSLLLAFSIGASLSGVSLYSYYEYRLTNTESKVDNYIEGFDERFRTASDTIDAQKQNAQAEVQKELEPLRNFQAEGGTLASLSQKVGKSIWSIQTLDEKGAPSVGAAFVVETNERESVLVGSYGTIRAATHTPGPEIFAVKGNDRIKVALTNWVEDKDLAAMTLPRGNQPKLDFVSQDAQPRLGERVFVGSGLGSAGASITQGFLSDVAQGAIQHDAAVGAAFEGGPLLNSNGQVTGIASTRFAPYGFAPTGGVSFAIPIRVSCEQLLRCPAGNNSVSGINARG